jgi:hypothetical protein
MFDPSWRPTPNAKTIFILLSIPVWNGTILPWFPWRFFSPEDALVTYSSSVSCEDQMKAKRRRRCEHCNKLKHDVETLVNPYKHDIDGITVKEALCKDCFENLQADI